MLVEITKINKEEVTVVSSLDVADTFSKEHKNVLKDIRELGCSEEFGRLNFELSYYINSQNKRQPMYYITKDGFTMLAMGYTGDLAMKFKEAYIKQFKSMEKLLQGKLIEREKGIAVRQSLTKAIQQSSENERMHGHAYSTYTNCIYKVIFGIDAKKLREKYEIGNNDDLRDCFTAEELKAVQSMERLVSGLVDCGWGYDQVKAFIEQTNTKLLAG
ncbi:Rha family transcriptional regulator [Lacrimispora sp.]|uniref:Rha family transcriptional regulator n=1 Tax=Lacrimispora sp. TaxID=2719234 RepID=UPI0028AF2A6C|nr:Rha family transcriptional regulator [Lacrimispora sp.]